jgi:hypothetical protein
MLWLVAQLLLQSVNVLAYKFIHLEASFLYAALNRKRLKLLFALVQDLAGYLPHLSGSTSILVSILRRIRLATTPRRTDTATATPRQIITVQWQLSSSWLVILNL